MKNNLPVKRSHNNLNNESLFTDDMKKKLKLLTRAGLKITDIIFILGICTKTYYNWKEKNKKFFENIEDWKNEADVEVEISLRDRALGYSHPETKVQYDSKNKKWVKTEIMKYHPPDATSAIFWLKNRQPEKWKDRREVAVKDVTVKIERKDFGGVARQLNSVRDTATRTYFTKV